MPLYLVVKVLWVKNTLQSFLILVQPIQSKSVWHFIWPIEMILWVEINIFAKKLIFASIFTRWQGTQGRKRSENLYCEWHPIAEILRQFSVYQHFFHIAKALISYHLTGLYGQTKITFHYIYSFQVISVAFVPSHV